MCNIYDDKECVNCKLSICGDDLEDLEFIKSLYPPELMDMQLLIEERCNVLEYAGSIMFDKYPDKVRIIKMCMDICKTEEGFDEKLIHIMLVNEMLRRRIRYRNCRGIC